MKKYILTTFSLPVEGEEAVYNKWYDEVHFEDLLRIVGVKTAQRFKPQETEGTVKNPYLSIYEIETKDIAKVMQSMQDGSHEMYISPALDISSVRIKVYEVLGDKQISK